ncbi:MAG: hypothetical protein IPI89_09905 [Propionivibrio sp.]|nr:hypothetical protein [Propionivibrio sp.]
MPRGEFGRIESRTAFKAPKRPYHREIHLLNGRQELIEKVEGESIARRRTRTIAADLVDHDDRLRPSASSCGHVKPLRHRPFDGVDQQRHNHRPSIARAPDLAAEVRVLAYRRY